VVRASTKALPQPDSPGKGTTRKRDAQRAD
jgi:hypothetical protein